MLAVTFSRDSSKDTNNFANAEKEIEILLTSKSRPHTVQSKSRREKIPRP
jgi:hypothetical protein